MGFREQQQMLDHIYRLAKEWLDAAADCDVKLDDIDEVENALMAALCEC